MSVCCRCVRVWVLDLALLIIDLQYLDEILDIVLLQHLNDTIVV